MKRTLTITICLLFMCIVNAQNKAKTNEKIVQQQEAAKKMIENYQFGEAATELQKYIVAAQKKRLETDVFDEYLDFANKGESMLTSTEKVIFIDSVVIDKSRFLDVYKLSDESGKIDIFKNVFKSIKTVPEVANSYTYMPQLQDKVFFSSAIDSSLYIFTRDRLDDMWSEAIQAKGLEEFGSDQISPFVLSDGTTMYFAAKGEESLGGYDIYITRYSSDGNKFLRPENIGMPFNSPDNDYMFAIDETNNLGWFVSDRKQPEGKVCVYVFIPNTTRENYSNETDENLANYAKINSIRDTWKDNTAQVNEALARLKELYTDKEQEDKTSDFVFVINDSRTYTSLNDFQSSEAKRYASQWLEAKKMLEQQNKKLQSTRDNYAEVSKSKKQSLSPTILQEEKQLFELEASVRKLEKLIRKSELTN